MGYAERKTMESRTGSMSSGLGSSPGMKGQLSKSSPFCPHSTSKLTQSIIKDHMVSHYKKVYSAKAVIDASVPKSMTHCVKYNDQIRKDRLKKAGRPQSAHSLSQTNSRASSSSAQSRLSVQYDDSPYLCSRSSMFSSPRFSTSFHAKDIVYQSCKPDHSYHTRPASEIKYRSPVLRRKQSACSLAVFGDHSCYKTFQDPVQKTYSGDLLQKHSQHFTQDKPFTPKTLKTDKSSYLAKYRYYRAPPRKPTQDCTNSKQETCHRRTKTMECTQESDPSQGFLTEHEWSEDELNGTYFSASQQQSRVNKSRDQYLFDSSSRVSPEVGKSPIMKNVSAEEEELMYLEFVSAVTEDILSREHISGRILDWVIKRHIDMNRHQLDVSKMRHLLDVLRKDFEEPTNASTSRTELEKKENNLLDYLLPHLDSGGKQIRTKEGNNLFPYASSYCNSPDDTEVLSALTPTRSPENTASPTKTIEQDEESDQQERCTGSPGLDEHVTNNVEISDEDFLRCQIGTATANEVNNEHQEFTTVSSDEIVHQDRAEVSDNEESKDLEDLERSLSRSLHVSAEQQHEDTAASASDDEF